MKPLLADETLFRDMDVFNPDYVPDQFLYRNEQLQALAGCVKPAFRGSRPLNALLVGQPATGKTTSIKIAMQQLEEHSKMIVVVYVNCSIMQSEFRIFSEIHKKVFGYLPPETGAPTTAVYDKIFCRLEKDKKVLAVALDDASFPNEAVYSILRAYEMYSVRTGVFAVMQKNEIHKLDDKTRSIFSPQEIRFLPYTTAQLFDILRNRAAAGLYPKVVSDTLLKKIAVAASDKNDLRFGIELLKRSALEAEGKASKVIREMDIRKALGKTLEEKPAGDEEILLKLIRQNNSMNSGKLFEMFRKERNVSYSTFYRLLKRLETEGKIITKETGKTGRTRIISPA